MRQQALTVLLAASLLLGASAEAAQKKFVFGDSKDVVEFTSDAPVEVIKGMTNAIKGHVIFDDSLKFDAKHPFDIQFEVDLNSLDTGIPLRNEHMRDNFLETKQYPKATFKAKSVRLVRRPNLEQVDEISLGVTGDFTVHGVTVKKTFPLRVTYMPESEMTKKRVKSGNVIRVRGSFPVKLEEHRIQRPEAIFVKLADTIRVSLDVMGTDGSFK